MSVIEAARKISEAGTKLDNLARKIVDQCPESSTKKDLLAYLERIRLYCHQMNITSKVRKSYNQFFFRKGKYLGFIHKISISGSFYLSFIQK